jgi:lipopolysaccharide export system protein LptA
MNMTIVADKGNLNRIDNSVHLEQNVRATTEDGATLTTDYLDWDAQNEKLSNDAPTWIKRGTMEAYGIGIFGQPSLNLVQLKKDVVVKISLKKEADQQALALPPPTVITCDGSLEVDYENNLAIFQDNVKVEDNRGKIFADRMDVYFATEAEESKRIEGMEGVGIDKVVALGNTEIHHGGNITYSQKAVYDTDTGKLTLTGEPKLVIYSTKGLGQLMETE